MAILTTDQSNYEDIADAIREKNGTGETYLPSEMAGAIRSIHGDVTGVKGDTENSYRTGNVNLTPANIGAKATQNPVASPSASGTAVEFIDSITQNAQGVITPTKKAVRNATTSQSGLMSAADKANLDNAVTDISGLKTRMTAAEDEMDILAIYPTASGKGALVTIEGTVDAPPAEMIIYGKSVQDGTPAPDAPVAIVTAGSGGTITMVSAGADMDEDPDKLTSAIDTTPNGLLGIPVFSSGNYTDTNGQEWLCDTIDLEAGTWTKRCGVVTLDGSENWVASTQVTGRYYLASTYTPNAVPYASHLCTHAVANPGSSTSDTGKSFFASGANFDINTEYASVEAFKAALATVNMVLVYALAAPVVTQLTEAQIAALRALRGRKGLTNLYSADPAGPEFRADMYIDIPTYIQSVIKKPLSLYDLNITPGTWNNIHPDFDPETEEYAVTLRKGNAATVNAVVIGTTATVTFGTIGGARTYFTMSTSSSAVGDRKTYACEVNPFAAGVGGGLVMTVTKGNLSRRYYLSITSVE